MKRIFAALLVFFSMTITVNAQGVGAGGSNALFYALLDTCGVTTQQVTDRSRVRPEYFYAMGSPFLNPFTEFPTGAGNGLITNGTFWTSIDTTGSVFSGGYAVRYYFDLSAYNFADCDSVQFNFKLTYKNLLVLPSGILGTQITGHNAADTTTNLTDSTLYLNNYYTYYNPSLIGTSIIPYLIWNNLTSFDLDGAELEIVSYCTELVETPEPALRVNVANCDPIPVQPECESTGRISIQPCINAGDTVVLNESAVYSAAFFAYSDTSQIGIGGIFNEIGLNVTRPFVLTSNPCLRFDNKIFFVCGTEDDFVIVTE